jgi:hypothetical protein
MFIRVVDLSFSSSFLYFFLVVFLPGFDIRVIMASENKFRRFLPFLFSGIVLTELA